MITNVNELQSKIRAILLTDDPMHLYSHEEKNSDEYDNEVKLIVDHLPNINNEHELLDLIFDIFMTRFGNLGGRTPKERYKVIASEIWKIVSKPELN
jgi:hypothetical protein